MGRFRGLAPAILLASMLPGSVSGWDLNRTDMLAMGGAVAAGKVLSAGTFNFWLDTGGTTPEEFIVAKDDTRYEPEGRRLVVGERVEVVYFEPVSASGSSLRRHARLVRMEGPPKLPDVPLGEWLDAMVSLPDERGVVGKANIWLPSKGLLLAVEHMPEVVVFEGGKEVLALPGVGDRIRLKLKVVPNGVGSCYTYVVTEARMAR